MPVFPMRAGNHAVRDGCSGITTTNAIRKMAKKKKDRGKHRGKSFAGAGERCSIESRVTREYNYLLRITPEDSMLLERYRDTIVQGTTGFAEVYYDHLFDNPDIAEALYRHERKGGNVGKLVRTELQNLLGTLLDAATNERGAALIRVGAFHQKRDIRPVWILSAYHLLIDYMQQVPARFRGASE